MRIHALTNTASGAAGEASVVAAFLRAGLLVADPYWNDDEVDLLVLWADGDRLVPIPVQVKSVQSKQIMDKKTGVAKTVMVVAPQGLRKKYIDRQPALCLAIYSPARDKIWFFPGASSIREAYANWLANRSTKGRKSKAFDAMDADEEVPIYVDVSKAGDTDFDAKWLLNRQSPEKLTQQIRGLARSMLDSQSLRAVMADMFTIAPSLDAQEITDEGAEDEPDAASGLDDTGSDPVT
ncbi:MAG TPA: hypothetical protein VF595_08970 [Tepidisphaeraceae bacterium]|jgi:hypothetical protein